MSFQPFLITFRLKHIAEQDTQTLNSSQYLFWFQMALWLSVPCEIGSNWYLSKWMPLFMFLHVFLSSEGLPRLHSGKRIRLPMHEMQETWVRSLVGKIPWRIKWQPTPVFFFFLLKHLISKNYYNSKEKPTPAFLPGKFHGQRSLVGYSSWDRKESDIIEWLRAWACTKLKEVLS